MRHVKSLGAVAIATATLAIFMGVGTASATVLCKNNLSKVKCTEPYPSGTAFISTLTSGGSVTFEAPGGTVLDKCTVSTTKETLLNAGSSTTTVTSSFTASDFALSGCTVTTATLTGGETELHWIPESESGTITANKLEVTINSGLADCVYGRGKTMSDWGGYVGGAPGLILLSGAMKKVSGAAGCPAEVTMAGGYWKTEPKAVYVTSG